MSKKTIIKQKAKGESVTDGAGVRINRIIGSGRLDYIDPFVLLDEIKSENADDYIAGFPTHPHRGIETITYMIRGRFRHRDSRGGGGLLTDGCVQWMTAGAGILHSEMPEETDGLTWGFQLWLSLKKKDKLVQPKYQHLSPDKIPAYEKGGLKVIIISGNYAGMKGIAENYLPADYFDVRLAGGASFTMKPDAKANRFIYVHTGAVNAGGEKIGPRELAELDGGAEIELTSEKDAGFLYLSARPNNEPIARGGPFVMNTPDEIRQAYADYRNGTLFKGAFPAQRE